MKKIYNPKLKNDEFLRVRKTGGAIEFALVYMDGQIQKWRWRYYLPVMEIVNRHTKKSKRERLNQMMWALEIHQREQV